MNALYMYVCVGSNIQVGWFMLFKVYRGPKNIQCKGWSFVVGACAGEDAGQCITDFCVVFLQVTTSTRRK